MKNYKFFLFLLAGICLYGCVSKIDIPDDEDSVLHITLEMLKSDTVFIAELKTSNNLNGTFPITVPNSAKVIIEEDLGEADANLTVEMVYDADTDTYRGVNAQDILKTGTRYTLTAEVPNSNLQPISAETIVPYAIDIMEHELLSQYKVEDNSGNIYWQNEIGLKFSPNARKNSRYAHLILEGYQDTEMVNSNGEVVVVAVGEPRTFELSNVIVGTAAVTDIIHRDGFFINFDDLEDDYIEIAIRSNHPITDPSHVSRNLYYKLMAISPEHYSHHIQYHRIIESEGLVFNDKPLYSSNIKNGFGLFSSCVRKKSMLILK